MSTVNNIDIQELNQSERILLAERLWDSIVDDQVRFLNDLNSLNELISSNKSEAEAMIQDLLDEAEESGSLVCN